MCFAGRRHALHPTQVLGRLVPVAALRRSAPTPATPPSVALSAAAALGIQDCVCLCVYLSLYLTTPGCFICTNAAKKHSQTAFLLLLLKLRICLFCVLNTSIKSISVGTTVYLLPSFV